MLLWVCSSSREEGEETMFQHRPAVKFCVPLIAGIALGWSGSFSVNVVLTVLCLLIALGGLLASSKYTSLALYASIMLLGILKITYDDKFAPHDRVSRYTRPGLVVQLKGRVSDLPVVRQQS